MRKPSGTRLALMMVLITWAVPGVAQRTCSALKKFEVEHIEFSELRYHLIGKFGRPESCDPDCPSSCSIFGEKQHAEEAFPQIRRQEEAFRAIVQHLGLEAVREFSSEQKLAVYREYKKLICGMSLEMQGENRKFKLVANGLKVEGIVGPKGEITVTDKEPVALFCPK
jgi:hypothetical protein